MPNLRIDFSSIEQLLKAFDVDLKDIPRQEQKDMISCAAKYVYEEVKDNTIDLMGKYSLGEMRGSLRNAVFIDKSHLDDKEPYAEIRFKGTVSKYYEPRDKHPRHRKVEGGYINFISSKKNITDNGKRRIEEIAFLNEYGVPRRGIKPRPYMKKSMDDGMNKAIGELLDILDDFITSRLVKAI